MFSFSGFLSTLFRSPKLNNDLRTKDPLVRETQRRCQTFVTIVHKMSRTAMQALFLHDIWPILQKKIIFTFSSASFSPDTADKLLEDSGTKSPF